jgi:hypothetical protein
MIGPQDERPKEGPEARQDAVTVELCDLDRGVCALLRVVRTAGETDTSALALVCLGGETVASPIAPETVRLETVEALTRWTARAESESVTLQAEFEAVSLPVDFAESLTAAAGVHRYEQLCRVRGQIRLDGRVTPIDGVGRRAHAWGDPTAGRFRSLYAVAGDRAVTIAAVQPREASDHGAEVIVAHLLRPESEPEVVQSARLSTVYDAAGRPRTAGLELFLEGDEFPRRVSGEAASRCACRAADGLDALESVCFRWTLDGDPAQGGYQVVSAA